MTRRGRVTHRLLLLGLFLLLALAPTTPAAAAEDNDCGLIDFGCKAADAINDAFVDLANKMIEAVGDATASLATFWMDTPEPDLGQMAGGPSGGGSFQPSPVVAFIAGSLEWLMLAAAVLSILIGAGRMAWERRAQPAKELARSLVTLILVAGCGVAGVSLLLQFSDGFSQWMIAQSTDDFGASLVALLALDDADVAIVAVILIIFVAFIALCASLIQIVLLVARNGFLVVLTGSWALSAAATNTEQGRATFQRQTSWLLAFILYKPAASIIYAVAFMMVKDAGVSSDPVGQGLTGFTLMVLSLVALPALMKLVSPVVGAATGGGGGGGMLAAAAVAAPSGSAIMRSSRGGGGAGAAAGGAARRGGSSGPTGSGPTGGGRGPSGGGPGGARPGGAPSGGAPAPAGSGGAPAGAAAGGGVATLTRGAAIAQTIGTSAAGTGTWDPGPTPPTNPPSPGGTRGN